MMYRHQQNCSTAGVQTSGQLCTAGVEVAVQNGAQRSVSRACANGLEGLFPNCAVLVLNK